MATGTKTDYELSSVPAFAVVEEFAGLELVLLRGSGEEQFHFNSLKEVEIQADLVFSLQEFHP